MFNRKISSTKQIMKKPTKIVVKKKVIPALTIFLRNIWHILVISRTLIKGECKISSESINSSVLF